jgi:bacterioferritin-associated ferredoxin
MAMYICICNALTEKDVRTAVDEGAASAAEIFGYHGVEALCGQCVPIMQRMTAPGDPAAERRRPRRDRRIAARPIGTSKALR